MSKNSPIFKLYAPEFNESLFMEFVDLGEHGGFPTEQMITFFSVKIPSMPLPNDVQRFGGQNHVNGFHAAIALMKASLFWTLTNNENAMALGGAGALNKLQMHVMDYGIKFSDNFGVDFLDTGSNLILQDMSGKKAMSAVTKFLKAKISDSDFQQGVEAAESLFSAYWEVLESGGVNLTDKKAPERK